MSLKEYSREELEVKSMLEIANEILLEEHKAMDFNELYDKTAAFKGFTDEQKQEFIAQFYTDLTVDGRFLMAGSGIWGLKRWYPVDQMDEEVNVAAKKKTKKKKQQKETKKETKKKKNPRSLKSPKNQLPMRTLILMRICLMMISTNWIWMKAMTLMQTLKASIRNLKAMKKKATMRILNKKAA